MLRTPSEIDAEAAGPRPEHLRVRALGPLEIEGDGGELTGPWTHQRPGQVFGYLLANRGRTVFPDELAEALWADSGTGGLGTVRYFVHALRDRLEPKRNRWKTNRFVAFRGGGYVLNTAALGIDIDDFEAEVKAGLDASRQPEIAVPRLERALELYRGEFLSDHPYADWARPMRDQLHVMASGALRELIRHSAEAGEDERAAQLRRRLAELEPLDHDIHREVILEHLRNNRHSLAARRYDALRDRVQRELGHPPRFDLQQLSRQILEEVS
ncbi:MAG: AfsR/SARP family transcriptional regulator [Solirubrobacteraceae bacterium]